MEYSIKLLTDQLLNLRSAIDKYKNGKDFNPQSPIYKDTQDKIRDLERGIKILKSEMVAN